jgi:YebC/PmpR family DNA-binding regulatory protein
MSDESFMAEALIEARAANMPRENIDRAIKKGSGELGNVNYEEIVYEGYGPQGTAIIVECLTDNKNRTIGDVRMTLDRNNGNLAASGAVSWMFQRKAHFVITDEANADEEKLMDIVLDAGAEDIEVEEGVAEIWAAPESFTDIAKALEDAGIATAEAGIIRRPDNTAEIKDATTAAQEFYTRAAKEYIYQHLCGEVRQREIAAHLGITPEYLCAVFKQVEGMPLILFANRAKLQHVRALMEKEGLSLQDAAARYGFADPNYASRLYKKYFGESITAALKRRAKG